MYLFYIIFFIVFITSLSQNVVDICDSFQVCVDDDSPRLGTKDSWNRTSVCSDWCSSGLNWTVLSSASGRVLFRLPPSPSHCKHTEYRVELETQKDGNQLQNYEYVHSRKIVHRCYDNCSANCKKDIEFEIPYVFSGNYSFNIQPFVDVGSHQACFTKPFFIQTDYQKLLLSHLTPNATKAYQSQSETLTAAFSGRALHMSFAVRVEFQWWRDHKTVTLLSSEIPLQGEDQGACCDMLFPSNCSGRYETGCACSFKDVSTLTCTFRNITPGNYCIVLSLHDPRCTSLTLWADNQIEPCTWHLKAEVYGSKTPLETKIDPKKNILSTYFMLGIIIFALFFTFLIIFVIYKPNLLRRVYKQTADSSHRGHLPHYEFVAQKSDDKYLEPTKKLKILLLYPRDCEEFMNVMSHFRIILKDLTQAEVYDPWDDDLYEQVAQSPTSWSCQYIVDYEVKIIIVLSKCSKIFEDAVICKKNIVVYREPHSFDVVFSHSLDAIHSNLDRYKRVFVVRFDENDLGAHKFDFINSFVVYNLPQSLGTLLCELHSVSTGAIIHSLEEFPQFTKFLASIEKYTTFKEAYVDYLNYLLH